MYDPKKSAAPWWLETFILTKAVFGILFWPLLAIFVVMAAIAGLFVAFDTGVGWGLLALAIIVAGILVFRWWDMRRPPRV